MSINLGYNLSSNLSTAISIVALGVFLFILRKQIVKKE
jgi:hypothetical protein